MYTVAYYVYISADGWSWAVGGAARTYSHYIRIRNLHLTIIGLCCRAAYFAIDAAYATARCWLYAAERDFLKCVGYYQLIVSTVMLSETSQALACTTAAVQNPESGFHGSASRDKPPLRHCDEIAVCRPLSR
jgi:hypothetical protein